MFSKAYKIATRYTYPVIISTRTLNNNVQCGCGAFILINNEGWILTASHVLQAFFLFEDHKKKINSYQKEIDRVKNNKNLDDRQKQKKIGKIPHDNSWITNHSLWWGADANKIENFIFDADKDIAIGKISNFSPPPEAIYPKFKKPSSLEIGTSLCKLGYPFHDIKATFDESTNNFTLAPDTLPMPFFPIEGMFTRVAINILPSNKKAMFIETSSPGLRGQSGGPIFDKDGVIWGVQSKTHSFPLGFTPTIEQNGNKTTENQFLNVGWGIHPEIIFDFLNQNKVTFESAE